MKVEVLVLSSQYDFSSDFICDRLRENKVPFLRINRDHLGNSNWHLTLDPVAAVLRVTGFHEEWVVNGDSLKSVWFRQPVFLRNTTHSTSPQDQLVRSQWMGFLRGLSVFEDALWANHPKATYLAESKPYQLRIASKLGFNIPATTITNDRASLLYDAIFPDKLILKAVDTVLLREDQDTLFPYSSITHLSEWTDIDFFSAPVICQQLLNPKIDLRVTVIGEIIYCVRIVEDNKGIEGDWRLRPKDKLVFEPHALSSQDAKKCLSLCRTLGLSFAAIDLAETKDGLYFIEVNPTGEWGWLNGPNCQIEHAICDFLISPKSQFT